MVQYYAVMYEFGEKIFISADLKVNYYILFFEDYIFIWVKYMNPVNASQGYGNENSPYGNQI